MRNWFLAATIILAMSGVHALGQTHPEVQAALDWQLLANECGARPQLSKGSDYANDTQETVMSDVDHYTRGRHKRALKRWIKCEERYRRSLLKDFGRLKDSVRHGMTQAQAEIVLGKLKLIQDTIETSAQRR